MIVLITTLECDGENVRRVSCIDDSGYRLGGSGMDVLDIGLMKENTDTQAQFPGASSTKINSAQNIKNIKYQKNYQ